MGLFCLSKVFRCLLLTYVFGLLACSSWSGSVVAQEGNAEETPVEQAASDEPSANQAESDEKPAETPSADSESSDTEATEPDAAAPPELAKLSYEPHIRAIFAAHCIECHGEKTAKADLRVDDRDSLLSYIAPGDLESSSLWNDYLVTADSEMRMPPPKSGRRLSAIELAAIRVWIEDGADWPEHVEPAVTPTPAAVVAGDTTEIPNQPDDKNLIQRSWTFVGFFHPAVVHLPIGLLLVSTLFTVLAFVKRETFEPAAFHCLWIGAAGAIAASFAGWAFADIRGYGDFWSTEWNKDLIARHRISGIAVTAAALILVLVATVARRRSKSDLRFVWLAGALVLAGLVSVVGHQGGELTYGEELFSRAYEQSFGDLNATEPQAVVQTAVTKGE